MSNKVRTRFAPSPTGYLHIGGLQGCLFDYLTAKSLGGEVLLRIEDTDQKREVEGAAEKLVEILQHVGIKFDEDPVKGGKYGPYIQSERLDIYNKYRQELLDKGEAYPCFCTEERLTQMRADQEAMKKPPRYDRACRDLSREEVERRIAAGEKYVIRYKMPLIGEMTVHEELRGDLKFDYKDLDDYVLIKSNGVPTYHFASVVDDHLMEISHVLRGSEWLPSFPKNASLYKSFGWEMPKFFHLPLILNKTGGKLSKRQGDVSVEDFIAKGYLPEAILNFVVLMGWSPYAKATGDAAPGDKNSEILTLEDMVKRFDPYKIGTSPAIFDTDKLDYLNGIYIRKKELLELLELCKPYLSNNLKITSNDYKKSDEFLLKVINLLRERLKTLSEIGDYAKFFFVDSLEYDASMLIWKKSTAEGAKSCLQNLYNLLENISENDWNVKKLEELIVAYIKERNEGLGDYLWPLRVALTGEKASPSPFEMAWALGKSETLFKIKAAVSQL